MTVKFSPDIQLSLSTAEELANYFTENEARSWEIDLSGIMPSGTYRVINDQLFQIVEAPQRPPKRLA